MSKKVPIVIALCIATFAGFTASLGGQMVPVPQSKLYSKTTVQMAYQVKFLIQKEKTLIDT